jgi:predicted  nucleic acid-binding Zn-ribbon protein
MSFDVNVNLSITHQLPESVTQMLANILTQLQAINGQETTLMKAISEIVQQLKDTKTKLDAEDVRDANLEQAIATLEEGLNTQSAALRDQVTTLQKTNADQATQITALNAQIAALQANGVDTTDLQAIVDGLTANVTAATTTHDKMQADLLANSPQAGA